MLIPPQASSKPFELTLHGHTRVDNYFWLRERDNPDVIAYLEGENAYTQAMMAHTETLQEQLYREMIGRIQETDRTAPYRHGDYYYYSRTVEGLQYDIYCRQRGSLEAEEEVLLDLNEIAVEYEYLKLGVFAVSPNHKLLAYSLDTTGGERLTLFVKDLENGRLLPDQIEDTAYSLVWANDNQTLFYTKNDATWRSYKLLRHTLGTAVEQDVEIYHETDDRYSIYISKTRDRQYLIMYVGSIETSENYFLDANRPGGDFRSIAPRRSGHRYTVAHRDGLFYMRTNRDGATNYKLMTVPVAQPDERRWQEYLPHRPDFLLEDIDLFARHLVVHGRTNGLQTITIHPFDQGDPHHIDFPEPVYGLRSAPNPEFNSDSLRFTYTSMTTADSVYDYRMDTRQRTLIKQKPVLGDYDPAHYRSRRLFATAADGTQIPISLFHRADLDLTDGPHPCLLYGYGSYGASMPPVFNSDRLSLVDRGLIFALAHIRGGQEMGRHWYDQGKFLHKRNTFTDFIACAEHLIAHDITSPQQLAIMGRSAGGLLMGAVVTMRPDLFRAVVAGVPFVDVVTTILDESLPLSAIEFEEWGNPNEKAFYEYMLSYSPYDNTTAQAYPHMLITAGLNDPRVQYWEPAKWTAKLRTVKTDDNWLLLKTHMGAGHFSASGRYDYLKDIAFEFAFILDRLGLMDK
ncbi:MAG: S9 family peptidase [Chloroflexota bacterium]